MIHLNKRSANRTVLHGLVKGFAVPTINRNANAASPGQIYKVELLHHRTSRKHWALPKFP